MITAALLLQAYQRLFTGPTRDLAVGFVDLHRVELAAVAPLLVLSALIGVVPGPLLAPVQPAAAHVARMVGG